MPEAPRDDLIRMVPLARAEAAADDGNTLVGYAVRFNEPTLIDSWEGRFRETIAPKALDKTLRQQGDRIKVLFNHGFDPQIGDKPLGKPEVMEPRRDGLWTETPLDDTSYNADLKALLRSGALDGMSFRFSVLNETWDNETEDGIPNRTINELKLYEFGPVTFPAYEATTAGVRNAGGYLAWRQSNPPQADAPDGPGRSTHQAAAPDDGGRITSESPPTDERLVLARADSIRYEQALRKDTERYGLNR